MSSKWATLWFSATLISVIATVPPKFNPVILVPGDGGSQFQAKLNKTTVVHYFCEKTSDGWFDLWLNMELMAPYILDCFVDNMKLVYDRKTRTTSNSPGVETRQPHFGDTSSVEYLDSSKLGITTYFYYIAEALEKAGLKRNVSIRGAPYDFRKSPNEMKGFLTDLKNLVEETYTMNGNRQVVLVGHSMGNPYIYYLLRHQPTEWKAKYIKSFVSLSGPFGGAVKPLRLMASGDNLGVFVVNPLGVRLEQRSMTSTAWLMPSADFWKPDEVLVVGPTRNYTVKDYQQFFTDIKYMNGWYMYEDTKDLLKGLPAPDVEVHCLHGIDVDTPAQFVYSKKNWPDDQPVVKYDNGDGTVNLRSLYGCLRWQSQQKQPIYHQEFSKVDHLGILKNQNSIDYIKKVVLGS